MILDVAAESVVEEVELEPTESDKASIQAQTNKFPFDYYLDSNFQQNNLDPE